MKHRTPNIERRTSNVPDFVQLGVQCWMFDVRCFRLPGGVSDNSGLRRSADSLFATALAEVSLVRTVSVSADARPGNLVNLASRTLLLRIYQNAVVDENNEVVLAVPGDIGHERFTRLWQIAAATAECPFFEHLPAVRRNKLAMRIEDDQVEIVLGRFEEHQVLPSVIVEVAGDDIVEMTVLDGRFVAVE